MAIKKSKKEDIKIQDMVKNKLSDKSKEEKEVLKKKGYYIKKHILNEFLKLKLELNIDSEKTISESDMINEAMEIYISYYKKKGYLDGDN